MLAEWQGAAGQVGHAHLEGVQHLPGLPGGAVIAWRLGGHGEGRGQQLRVLRNQGLQARGMGLIPARSPCRGQGSSFWGVAWGFASGQQWLELPATHFKLIMQQPPLALWCPRHSGAKLDTSH